MSTNEPSLRSAGTESTAPSDGEQTHRARERRAAQPRAPARPLTSAIASSGASHGTIAMLRMFSAAALATVSGITRRGPSRQLRRHSGISAATSTMIQIAATSFTLPWSA